MNNIKKTYNMIWQCFKAQDYYGVLENFEKYLSFEKVGVTDTLMSFYATSLEQLGFSEQALKAYIIYNELYDTPASKMKIIHLSNRASDIKTGKKMLNELLLKEPNNPYYHYLLGKFCLFEDQLEEAKYHFEKSLTGEFTFILKANKYLNGIIKREQKGTFLKVGYDAFIKRGDILKPGHIIEVKNRIEYINKNEKNGDQKSTKRSYLIWKVEEDKVYAFSITGKINYKFDHVISPEKYYNLNTEVTCKDNVCIIDRKNIRCVVEKISSNDLKKLLIATYDEIMHSLNHEQEKRIEFIKEVQKQFKLVK